MYFTILLKKLKTFDVQLMEKNRMNFVANPIVKLLKSRGSVSVL